MNPNRTYEENMAALKKVLTQRTYTALSHRNIEFVLKYQNAYDCRSWLHICGGSRRSCGISPAGQK